MFILDKPYVSDFLKETIRSHSIPLLDNAMAQAGGFAHSPLLLDSDQAVAQLRDVALPRIYTNSENAIGWIAEHLAFTELPEKIELFKNKVRFRELLQPLYPDFFYKEIAVDELEMFDTTGMSFPFVIKPAVGFFSMGVHKVNTPQEWTAVVQAIRTELEQVQDLYPQEVLDTTTFILEECIRGDEYAIDAYFDADGEAVIVNIHKHIFSSAVDVSDRVYMSSREIIEANLAEFNAFLQDIGRLAGVRNFPMHIELRRSASGMLLPIEVNPLRFGGWCTTGDATWLAYGFNPYEYYFTQQRPDWPTLLADKAGKVYSIIVLDNSTGVPGSEIESFDYDKLLAGFEHPLELRRIDYRAYPVFGFLFTETRSDNMVELQTILTSDLREFTRLDHD